MWRLRRSNWSVEVPAKCTTARRKMKKGDKKITIVAKGSPLHFRKDFNFIDRCVVFYYIVVHSDNITFIGNKWPSNQN